MTNTKLEIGPKWEAVGPFPSGMREHPFMGTPLAAFPREYGADPDLDFTARAYGDGTWPSELATGGKVGWAKFESDKDGQVVVRYPDINWEQLRGDHGWAALQYRAELRTTLTIPDVGKEFTNIRVDSLQAAEYAFVPHKGATSPVMWYRGDVYAFGASPTGRQMTDKNGPSNLARSLYIAPGDYTLLVRAMYEVRMFGDPGKHAPEIKINMGVWTDDVTSAELVPGMGVVPDVVDGWLMGEWAAVGVRVPPRGEMVRVRGEVVDCPGLKVAKGESASILPALSRAVPMQLVQTEPITADELVFRVVHTAPRVMEDEPEVPIWELVWRVKLKHHKSSSLGPFQITHSSGSHERKSIPTLVSWAMVVPPKDLRPEKLPPVLLALHGAGVHAAEKGWIEAMPDAPGMWAVLPTGRTEWGEDWHGGSLADLWSARDALPKILKPLTPEITVSEDTLLIGHSNGGQGAWHAAARFPDRIVGVIAVSGWLKIQDYVPYTEVTGSHYADPALLGVLSAALGPYNNDLYASNLASVPVLAVHGAEDDNVPPRHGRAHAGIVSAWTGGDNVKFVEVPKKGHFWDGVLRHPAIKEFIATLPPKKSYDDVRRAGFTLATANPDETGSKAGIRIAELAVPGRLARLDVNMPQWRDAPGSDKQLIQGLDLHGTNIKRIEIMGSSGPVSVTCTQGRWHEEMPAARSALGPARVYGPMMRVLASSGGMTIVLPPEQKDTHLLRGLARAYAHDLYVYHRLDVEVLDDGEAFQAVVEGRLTGSLVVFGRPEKNRFSRWLVGREDLPPVSFPTRGLFAIDGRTVWEKGTGLIATYNHHTPHSPNQTLLLAGNDDWGVCNAARLLPLRTGVPVPDWIVASPRMAWQGAGGLVGAGFWNGEFGWSEGMSWMDREAPVKPAP